MFRPVFDIGRPKQHTERWTVSHHNRNSAGQKKDHASRTNGIRCQSSVLAARQQTLRSSSKFLSRREEVAASFSLPAKPKIWRGFNQVWGNVSMNFNTTCFCPFMPSCRCARQVRPKDYTLDLKLSCHDLNEADQKPQNELLRMIVT